MKKNTCIILMLSLGFFVKASGQAITVNPNARQIINFDPIAKADPIPFDQPFILQYKSFPATGHIQVKVYKKYYDHGKRLFDNLYAGRYQKVNGKDVLIYHEVYKSDRVAVLTAKQTDTSLHTVYRPEFTVQDSVKDGNLNLYFPGVKPNSVFDVLVIQDPSADEIKAILAFNKIKRGGDPVKIAAAFTQLQQRFTYKVIDGPNVLYTFEKLADYDQFYSTLSGDYDLLLDRTQYLAYGLANPVYLKEAAKLLGDCKLDGYLLYTVNEPGLAVLADGHSALGDQQYTLATDDYDFDQRQANLDKSIHVLDSLYRILGRLQQRPEVAAAHQDGDIDALRRTIGLNVGALMTNQAFLKKHYKTIRDAITNSPKISNQTWLIGNSGAKDIQTLSGSILSTEFGMTNIFIKNNNNKTIYLPRLFMGVDIFFRQVNRDIKSKYLYHNEKEVLDLYQPLSKEPIHPDLISTRTSWQHLSLSLGLTLGNLPNTDFNNFYNTFSLTAGPSYRFCRVLRLSAGAAFMKRQNPNPLLTNQPVAVGYYASFSVDLNFLKAANDFFSMITK